MPNIKNKYIIQAEDNVIYMGKQVVYSNNIIYLYTALSLSVIKNGS